MERRQNGEETFHPPAAGGKAGSFFFSSGVHCFCGHLAEQSVVKSPGYTLSGKGNGLCVLPTVCTFRIGHSTWA